MDTAKAATRSGTISEFSMVLLNNALSFPPAIVMILAFGEYDFILKSYVFVHPFLFLKMMGAILFEDEV